MRAGIIGCGNIAWRWDRLRGPYCNTHAKAYYKNRLVRLKACTDIDFKKAKGLAKAYPGVMPYGDYKRMLEKEDLDIVSVCTPISTHYRILEYILKNTNIKYIVAEKPLTSNLEEARKIVKLAKRKKVHISVNYLRRWDKTLSSLRKAFLSLKLGDYISGNFVYYGGVKENAIHLIDFLKLLGLDIRFSGFTSKVKRHGSDFSGSFLFKTDRGMPVYFNWIDRKDFASLEGNLFYKNGRIRLGDYSDVDIFKVTKAAQYTDFRELKLKKHLPPTICTAMKYSIGDIVKMSQKNRVDHKALDRELELLSFIEEMEKVVK